MRTMRIVDTLSYVRLVILYFIYIADPGYYFYSGSILAKNGSDHCGAI